MPPHWGFGNMVLRKSYVYEKNRGSSRIYTALSWFDYNLRLRCSKIWDSKEHQTIFGSLQVALPYKSSKNQNRFSEAQMLGILRQQDQGQPVVQLCWEHGIREPTFYGWKRKFGGMSVSELQRLKHREDENRRLKRLYAELSLEHPVIKEVLRKK